MKRLMWLGLIFLATSWLFFIPIFTLSDYNVGLIFLIIGIISNILSLWRNDFKRYDKKYLIVLIPLLISLFIIPLPYSIGPAVLTIGIILYSIKNYILKKEEGNWVLIGISLSGVILTIQTLFIPVYVVFSAHYHRIDIFSPFVSSISNLFGLKTSLNNGIVFVQTLQETYPFTTTWEKLGFYPWFNIMIGALVLFFFLSKSKKIGKYILGFFLFSGVYLILRYILLIFVFTQTKDVALFWDPMVLFMSFIPFSLLLMRLVSLKSLEFNLDCFKGFNVNKNRILAMILLFVFVFSLVGAFVFQDPGTEKQGRILIDELHSDWEDSSRTLDKEWYGMLSTYNYYCWAEWLDKYYDVDRNINDTLSSGLLSNYDILILKCPTNSYSDEETSAIINFVENGGGLYMIGDHTNVFGMNYYLNQVSESFDITFNTDATYELGTGALSTYKPDVMFPHTVVQNMEEFNFLTSCTLNAPITSENVIIGNRLMGEPGTYSTENFFRESIKSPDLEHGLILQVAALKYGKGRVLAFTDSTCFSNFCMFMDGYKSFNLGTIEYLNRINTYSYLNTLFIGISVVSLALTVYLLRKENKTMIIFLFLLIGLLAFSMASPIFSNINEMNYPLPSAHSDYTKVCFDQEHSDVVISHSPSLSMYGSHESFDTFFVWTQRVGCVPSLEKTLDDAIDNGDIVVIINPVESFDDEEIAAVNDYVNSGGMILLMDSALNADSSANQLLKDFDITLSYETSDYSLHRLNDTISNLTIGNVSTPYLNIIGGEDVFIIEDNRTSMAVTEMGEGKIVVVVDSYTFSNNVLGGTFTEPDGSLRKIYDTEYYIFEELLLK